MCDDPFPEELDLSVNQDHLGFWNKHYVGLCAMTIVVKLLPLCPTSAESALCKNVIKSDDLKRLYI